MQAFTFRPYYAFDCDSEMGFNNGRYLDAVTVTARDEIDARGKVMELLADMFDFTTIDADETQALDVDAAWTFAHVWVDEEGNQYADGEIPADPDGDGMTLIETECQYLYRYLDLGEPETQTAGA